MSDTQTSNSRNAAQCAREDFGNLSAVRVAQGVGSFADDPADSRFQRAYLRELWSILREKISK